MPYLYIHVVKGEIAKQNRPPMKNSLPPRFPREGLVSGFQLSSKFFRANFTAPVPEI